MNLANTCGFFPGQSDPFASFVNGGIIYAQNGRPAQNADRFFWDSANHRLGIATNTPSQRVHMRYVSTTPVDGLDFSILSIDGYRRSGIEFYYLDNLRFQLRTGVSDSAYLVFTNSAGTWFASLDNNGRWGFGSNLAPSATYQVKIRAASANGLIVQGVGSGSTTNPFRVENASGSQIIETRDNVAIGFLGATPATQQTGGAATAGGTFGATEQDMLQKAYDALRIFGFLN